MCAPNDDNDDGIEVEEDSLSSNIDTVITTSDCEAPEKYFKEDLVLPNKKNRVEDAPYTSQTITSGNASVVDVRIIDFAHTTFAPKASNSTVTTKTVKVAPITSTKVHLGPDNGFLTGLNSLTRILSDILFEHYQEK